jgi:terminal uridylyltransferase
MDLCCLIDSENRLPAGDLVNMLGDLLERGMSRLHGRTFSL